MAAVLVGRGAHVVGEIGQEEGDRLGRDHRFGAALRQGVVIGIARAVRGLRRQIEVPAPYPFLPIEAFLGT